MEKIILGARPPILEKLSNSFRLAEDHILLFPESKSHPDRKT